MIQKPDSQHSLDDYQQQYQKIRIILEQMPIILFAFDMQGCLCAWNREAERVTGYSAHEMIGNPNAMKLLCPDADYRRAMLDAYRQKGDDYRNWDWQLVAKDGSVKTISFSNISAQYPIEGWANWGVGVDLSLCRETEHKLRERVKELNCLYKLSQLSNQPQLNIDSFLQSAVDLLPQSFQYPETTVARCIYQGQIFKTDPFAVTSWQLSSPLFVRGHAVGTLEVYYTVEHPPSAEGPFLLEERLLIDEISLQISRTLGHVLARQDLALLDELGAKSDELETFAHSISHDLRTPLTAIGGYAQFILKEVKRDKLDQVITCAERIADITVLTEQRVNELLKLAKLGKVIEPNEDVDFREIVADTLTMMAKRLEDAGITVEVDHKLPVVLGDRTRLLEVIENLLDNAIKYIGKHPRRIKIGTFQKGDETVLYVEDNGIGIDPQHAEDVFELFWRLDKSSYGDGTGLAIARRIIKAHGGRIWAESAGPGEGACFCFTLGHVVRS